VACTGTPTQPGAATPTEIDLLRSKRDLLDTATAAPGDPMATPVAACLKAGKTSTPIVCTALQTPKMVCWQRGREGGREGGREDESEREKEMGGVRGGGDGR
jgi:hypothetical protein